MIQENQLVSGTAWWRSQHGHCTIFAPPDSPAQNRIDELLSLGNQIPAVLASLLEFHPTSSADESIVALFHPLGPSIGPDSAPPFDVNATILIPFASDSPSSVLIAPLVEHCLTAWFGHDAGRANVMVDGLSGLIASHLHIGPSLDEVKTALRTQSGNGTVLVPMLRTNVLSERVLATASFVAFLLDTPGGAVKIQEFLRTHTGDTAETAPQQALGQSMCSLEESWAATFTAPSGKLAAMSKFFRYFLPLLKPHGWKQLELLAYMFLGLAFTLILPLSSKYLVDSIIPTRSGERIVMFVLVLLVIYLANGIVTLRRTYVTSWISQHIMVALAERLFTHMQKLPHGFYVKAKVGDLMSRLTNDVMIVQSAMSQVIGQAIYQTLTALAVGITVIVLSPLLGLLVIATVPLFAIPYTILRSRIQTASYEQGQMMGEAAASAQENLTAHAVIKAFGLEQRSILGYHGRLMAVFQATMRLMVMGAFFEASVTFAASLGELIMLGAGGYLVMQDRLTLGTLLAFWALLPTLYMPIAAIANLGQTIEQASGSVERLDEVLTEPLTVTDRPGAAALHSFSRDIRFDHVSFAYASRPTVRDLTFTIPKGAHVAFVGPSGSGKSTIVNLLLRFWDPQSGTILFDDHDVRDIQMSSLREQIGLVFQDTFVFNSSIRENIAIGHPGATDEEVIAAAKAARLHDYIVGLPAGYDTVSGEHGVQMSGGQRQRLAIARALIRQPQILVFDEATSALDPVTEAEIQRTFDAVGRGRTRITITHRLTSITSADLIYVLRQGEIIEAGRHTELVTAGGLYQQLFEEQSGIVKPTAPDFRAATNTELRTFPILHRMSDDQLQSLANRLTPGTARAGEVVIRQGEPGNALYLIRRGEVDVSSFDGIADRNIAVLDDGDYFGEMSLLTDLPRSATITASKDCELLVLSRDAFNEAIADIPEWGTALRDAADTRTGIAVLEV